MKRILVTGGAQRLGRVMAETLARPDRAIAIHYRQSGAEAESLVSHLSARGVKAAAIGCDLADADAVKGLIEMARAALGGPLTGLVNSASLFEFDRPEAFSKAAFDAAMAVNLRAPMLLGQDFFAQADPGFDNCIVQILDQKLWNYNPDFFSYTLSKAALLASIEMLSTAYAPKVRVCGLAPGLMFASFDQSEGEFHAVADQNLAQRRIALDAVGRGVDWLMSESALFGQILHIDNGQRFVASGRDVIFTQRDRA